MPTRFALCASLTIALLAAPASALAADVVVPSSVQGSTTVPAGGARTLTLRCPATAVALNAAVTRRGAGVTVRRSIPGIAAGDWRFRLTAAKGALNRSLRAVLRCVRLHLPSGVSGARLHVSTRRPPVTVPAGGSTTVRIRCGRAWVGTGYGFDPGTRGDVRLTSVVPKAHGWDFRLENGGSAEGLSRLSGRCLRQTVSASRGGTLRFGVARRAFSDGPFQGGRRFEYSHRCARSQFSLATGFILDPSRTIEVANAYPVADRFGHWRFRRTDGDQVTTFLVCLSRRSSFR